ncbi:MAG TPA: hypothetical protein DCQ28_01930, partial [Bacteroidetes bacterium]|nr:hypothetical protein [Bacteroidota bacterium]
MWSGDATGTANPLQITMDANKYITASFNFSSLVPPSAPSGFYAIAKNGFVLLKWKKNPEADILRYRIFGDTFASPSTLIDSTFSAADTSKFIGGLINGTTYYFRIIAVDSAGNQSPYSIDDAATPIPEPGHALTLDGFGDFANVLNPKLPQGNTPRTIEAWFRTTSTANQVIATWGNLNVNERACLMIDNGLPKYVGESNDLLGTIAVNDGLWHHVAATFDGTNLTIFVDGKFDVSAPMTFNTIGTILKIGDGFNEYFDGQIDEIKIWDAARTQTEIQYSKDKTAAGDENGLVSYYRFDESSMPISFDGSPIGANLTLFGDAGFVTSGAMIPSAPTNLISYPGESQVYLFWNKNPEFDLYRYLIYGGTTANPTMLIDSTIFGNSDDTTAIINGLTNYTDYYFRVTAVDSTGIESAFSAEIVTQPIDQTGLPVPASVQIIDSLQSNFTIQWITTTGSDFRAYLIYGGTTPSPEFLIDSTTSINDTSKVISGLTAGTPYYFFVTAIDTNGNESGSSNHVSATPYVNIMIIAKKFGNGIISPIDTTFVIPGNSLLYSFSPGNYYHFDSVLVDGIRNVDSLVSYTFENVVSDHTIDVYFSIDTYNLNVISAQGIVNKIPDSLQYSHGMEVQLTAVPNPGYSFSIWGGDTSTTNNPFTITVDTIKNITAFYALNTYSLTTNAVNGTVLKTPDSSMYSYGMPVVLIAIPDSGYSFIGWSGDTVELNNPITVTMYGEKNITANFSLNVYQITASVSGDGIIVPSGLSNVNFGDTVHYSFLPNTGSHFDSLVVNGAKIDSVNSFTFFNITTAQSITAYFSPNIFHHFIIEAGSGGAINPQTAGQTFSIRTTAVDSLDNIVTSFTGNVWFSSTDTLMGVLGGNFSIPFIAGQQGPQIIALYRAGNNTISVIDSLSGKKGTSSPFVVNPSGLSHFVVKDTFGLDILQQVQASPFPIKIIASDTYGNVQ